MTVGVDTSAEEAVKRALDLDPWLGPFHDSLKRRYERFLSWIEKINSTEGGIDRFTRAYEKFGFSLLGRSIVYREWAPGANFASLTGEFNNWSRESHKMTRNEFGVWEITLDEEIPHGTKVKISMIGPNGQRIERVPAWIRRAVQDPKLLQLEGVFWNPPEKYVWRHKSPVIGGGLKIYEAHIGICTPEPRVSSYNDFRTRVLPLIHDLGYNCIQLMAIMEHAYYACFGYQVTNFFAVSSRYGTPEELMQLIDEAHGRGIIVLLDVVHSHACKNVLDGLNEFDGTGHHYFHAGSRGHHDLWDSRLFNYNDFEVMRFLLSNLRFFIEEYHFDGFRFDGVTSMMYTHHGINYGFSGNYNDYFGHFADEESILYLTLANYIMHKLYPNIVSIAEDVSGMPTLCRPVEEGGIGFDYRLGMAIPDMWIKILKHSRDEEWDLDSICFTLTNRRHKEKTIGYCESHDQALVGDKTLAFWLMDSEMYHFMTDLVYLTPVIDRGLALHKMIRLLTHSLGGEAYLNFMGNEFGHPEWLDFPRAGNNNSYHYARRQYNLVQDPLLRYKYLYQFDKAMQHLEERYQWLTSDQEYISLKHYEDKVVVFERAGLLFAFNFHSVKSFVDYRVGVEVPGKYKVVLDSDSKEFCGHGRIDHTTDFFTFNQPWSNRANSMLLYLPSRSAIVLAKE